MSALSHVEAMKSLGSHGGVNEKQHFVLLGRLLLASPFASFSLLLCVCDPRAIVLNTMYYRLLMLLQTAAVSAFVTPRSAAMQRVTPLGDSPAFLFPPTTPSILLSDADADALQAMGSANPIFEGIKTILVILTAAAFALFGLSFVTAAVLIPKAAEQLEERLWD